MHSGMPYSDESQLDKLQFSNLLIGQLPFVFYILVFRVVGLSLEIEIPF